MKIVRRMTAGLMVLCLIITMLMPQYGNTAKASNNKNMIAKMKTYTEISAGNFQWEDGFIPKHVIKDRTRFKIEDISINWQPISIIAGSELLEFGQGREWYDPDEPIYPRTNYNVRFSFEVADLSIFDGITSVQVYLGPTAYSDTGYEPADLYIENHRVYMTFSTRPYSLEISQEAVWSVSVDPVYKSALPEKLTLLNGAPFTSGKIEWFFFDNGTRKSVTKATYMADIANNKFYYLKVVVSAKYLFEFNTYGPFYNKTRPDGTEIEVRVLNKGEEAEITITKIVPRIVEEELNVISAIIPSNRLSFGTSQVNIAVDVIPHLPNALPIKVYGTDATASIPFKSITDRNERWHIYAVSGNEIGNELSMEDEIIKDDNAEYIAVYPYSALLSDIAEAEYVDLYHLIDTYRYDADYPGSAGHEAGYTIRFSVRPPHPSTGYGQDGYARMDNPEFEFVYNGMICTYFVKGQCATGVECVTNPAAFDFGGEAEAAFNPGVSPYGVCSDLPGIYKAVNRGINNYTIDSALLYEYFNPEDLIHRHMSMGAVSIVTQTPKKGEKASYDVAVAATYDFEKGLAANDAILTWSPKPVSVNSDFEEFLDDEEYVATITIPMNHGYDVTKMPVVRVNGVEVTDVTVTDKAMVVKYKFPKTDKELWIDKDGNCSKLIYFTTPKPYAGIEIPDTVKLSDTCSKMFKVKELKWYAGADEISDGVFEKGKRYSLIMILDAESVGVEASVGSIDALIGSKDYVTNAGADSESKLVTIVFDFGVCESGSVEHVNDVEITLPRGLSTEDFFKRLDTRQYTELIMSDGNVAITTIKPGYNNANPAAKYAKFSDEFKAKYYGVFGYDEKSSLEQVFVLDAIVDLADNGQVGEVFITFTIRVAGEKCKVTFDANGGRYTGIDVMEVEAGRPYGFKYVPDEYKREGYLFAGWFTEATGGTRIYSTSIVKGSITLYAHWVKVFTGKVYDFGVACEESGSLKITPKHPATKIAGYEVSVSYNGKDWKTTSFTGSEVVLKNLTKGFVHVKVRAYRIDSAGMRVYGAYSMVKTVEVR
ncbi:MAG: InlB B-repeat-containing protein [Lachnospiraceae bacterium]|nr:InlB B-repeat-containing protein [Lachnospiraceae bacterium]